MKRINLVLMALVLSGAVRGVEAEVFELDPMHTNVGFKIRHLGVTNVNGRFSSFTGSIDYDAKDVEKSTVRAVISAASIDTGIGKRDDNLRSPEFFDVSKYPTVEFKSTGVEKAKDGTLKLKGDLTMHGVTKAVVLDLEVNGVVDHPMAGRRAGFTATGTLDRLAFGVGSDNPGLSKDVKLILDVEASAKVQKKDAKAPAKK